MVRLISYVSFPGYVTDEIQSDIQLGSIGEIFSLSWNQVKLQLHMTIGPVCLIYYTPLTYETRVNKELVRERDLKLYSRHSNITFQR